MKKSLLNLAGGFLFCALLASKGYGQVGITPVITNQPSDKIVLINSSVIFKVGASSLTTLSYKWYYNSNLISGATASSYTNNSAQLTNAGYYHVAVINLAGTTLSRVASLSVLASNDIPVVNPDTYTAQEDTPLTISAPGVLSNDTDLYPGGLSAVLASNPSQGSLSFNTNGSFTYSPNPNFNGADSFTYRALDGGTTIWEKNATGGFANHISLGTAAQSFRHGTAGEPDYSIKKVVLRLSKKSVRTANLYFSIGTGMNSGPLAGSSYTIAMAGITNNTEGASFGNYDIVYSTPVGPFTAGTTYYLNLENASSGGDKVYVERSSTDIYPRGILYSDGSNTGDDMRFEIHEETFSGIGTVVLNVTPTYDPLVAVNDTTNTPEDTSVTINVLGNDFSPDGLPLTITGTSTTNGTAIVSGGNIVFTPSTNFYGITVFNYTISDGTSSATASVTVNVSPVSDYPPVANNDTYSAVEDTTLTIPAAGVLSNDTDGDGDPITALLVSSASNGTVSLNPNGSFSYTPATNFNGIDSFTYRATDGTFTGNVATVTLNVAPVNDPPRAVNDTTNTLEDVSVTINVLANDSDVDGDLLTITGTSTTNGTAVISGSSVVFTPSTNYNGTTVFSYTISDGAYSATANVTVIVTPVNDAPPVASNDTYITAEDVQLIVPAAGILANDTDVDGDPKTALLVSSVTNGSLILNTNGSFIYTPNTNYYGSDSFTYRATDGMATGNVATVTINVTSVNDAPFAVNDSANTLEDTSVTIDVLANDSDVEGTLLTIIGTSTTNGTAIVSGTNIVFTPSTNFYGTVVFNYTVSDGTNSASANVTVAVASVNDAPVAVNDSVTTAEDTSVTIKVLLNDYDVDGTPLTITSASTTNGTATISGTNIVFRASTNYNGTVVFNYTISDGVYSATGLVTVVVSPVNDAPVALDDTYTTLEDVPLVVPAPGVLGNDTDVETGALTALLITTVSHGSLTFNTNGSFTYTPSSNYFGEDFFTYRASDGVASSAVTTVFLDTILNTPLKIASWYKVTNGFELELEGPAPAVYTVFGSTNQIDWLPLASLVAFNGSADFVDTNPGGFRFYRASVGEQSTVVLEQNGSGGNKIDIRLGKPGAQSFKHGVVGDPAYTLSRIVLYLSREATAPSTNLNFNIGTGLNSGAIAVSRLTIDPLTITNTTSGASFQRYELTFQTPVGPFTAGTTYYINLDNEGATDKRVYFERSGGVYGNGTFYRGGTDQGFDARFEMWGQ